MNKRNGIVVGIFSIFLLTMLVMPMASAYYLPSVRDGMDRIMQSLVDIFEPILAVLFGGFSGSTEFLFEKLLLFVLLVTLVFVSTKNISAIEEQKAIRWVISLVVPLMAVRWINAEWLSQILTQYGILGIVLTSFVPFLLYFYILYTFLEDFGLLRQVGWLIFIGIYIGLWSSVDATVRSNVYLWTVVGAIICMFGDDYIFKKFRYIKFAKSDKNYIMKEVANTNDEILKINKQINAGTIDRTVGERLIKDLDRHRKMLMKM